MKQKPEGDKVASEPIPLDTSEMSDTMPLSMEFRNCILLAIWNSASEPTENDALFLLPGQKSGSINVWEIEMADWSDCVQIIRALTGMTNKQLAKAAGVTMYTVRNWRRGENETTVTTLEKLAKFLEPTNYELYLALTARASRKKAGMNV